MGEQTKVTKTYKVERLPDGDVIATVGTSNGDIYPLRHWKFHSPTRFNFSYSGSGPADLALAILLDYFDEWPTKQQMNRGSSLAWHGHQKFKFAFIATAKGPGFTITTQQIDDWANNIWFRDNPHGLAELRESIKLHEADYEESN